MKENEIEAARNRITLAGRQAGLEDGPKVCTACKTTRSNLRATALGP